MRGIGESLRLLSFFYYVTYNCCGFLCLCVCFIIEFDSFVCILLGMDVCLRYIVICLDSFRVCFALCYDCIVVA